MRKLPLPLIAVDAVDIRVSERQYQIEAY